MDSFEKSYCHHALQQEADNVHRRYHDTQYGFPVGTDQDLFKRLVLEINQAGLSWTTILKKEAGFDQAYDQFHIATVAAYGPAEVDRLLQDPAIIRNRLKVAAAIHNAQVILQLQAEHGSFAHWLDQQGQLPLSDWVKRFKRLFRFTGGEICNEFLRSTGYLPGAHHPDCPTYPLVLARQPAWLRAGGQ
ncbi:MAG: DNA-3-methyladenine glycosylase I [Bacteroidetes bacterium]|jgi:DNA-3-methyladenine glycosylase I|nr:DNA-3-methyladenine glycosylase I [Bacteroidota bacterium]